MLLLLLLFFIFLIWWKMQLLKKKCCLRNFLKLFPFFFRKGEGGKKKKKRCQLCFHPTAKHFDSAHQRERIFPCSVRCWHVFPSCSGTLEKSCPSIMPPFSSGAGCVASSLTRCSLRPPWTDITSQVIHEESPVYQRELKQKANELQLLRGKIAMQNVEVEPA